MIRRRRQEEADNTHRWLVSYADFITLLFAFFVVMYSISQVNEGKYRVLSDALLTAFEPRNEQRPENEGADSTAVLPGGAGLLTDQPEATPDETAANTAEQAEQEALSLPVANAPSDAQKREFNQLYNSLQESLQPLIDAGVVVVRGNQDWLEVDMRSGLLFESGSDVLGKSADSVISELAAQLKDHRNLMRIRGYTDNQAIDTERFPSNWELASARAVAVVRKLQSLGIPPSRMAVEGFGEFNSIASNSTAEGRARNRRVVLAISRLHEQTSTDTGKSVPAVSGQDLPSASTDPGGATVATPPVFAAESEPDKSEQVDVVRLPSGGLLIRGKERPETEPAEEPPKPTP